VPGQLAFFSLAHLADPGAHRDYNEWHQLDHRPENLLLPGVAWGERWVRSPECAAIDPPPDPGLGEFHYLNMYWFREPTSEHRRAWSELAERSFHWGRRADLELCTRPMMGFYVPVRGEVARRVRVSADALPLRPNRGVHLEVLDFPDARSVATMRWFDWYDRVRVPELLARPGVAGVWSFAAEDVFTSPLDLAPGEGSEPRSTRRIHLAYLDREPTELAPELRTPATAPEGASTPHVLFSGVLRSITPWEWDWFERDHLGAPK